MLDSQRVPMLRLCGCKVNQPAAEGSAPRFFCAMEKKYTAAWDFLNLNDTLFLGGTFSLIDAAPRRQAGRMQSPPKPWNPHCADLGRLTHVLIIFEEIYLCVLYSDPYIAAVYPTYYAIYVRKALAKWDVHRRMEPPSPKLTHFDRWPVK